MNQHTPTAIDLVYTCDQCSFRAVQTTAGLFLLDPGIGRALHEDAITALTTERREWVYQLVTRIRGLYGDGALLPACDGYHAPSCTQRLCSCVSDKSLDLRLTQRLVRAVMMEYEG